MRESALYDGWADVYHYRTREGIDVSVRPKRQLYCGHHAVGLGPCEGEIEWRNDVVRALCQRHWANELDIDPSGKGMVVGAIERARTRPLRATVVEITDTDGPHTEGYKDWHSDDVVDAIDNRWPA